MNQLRSWLIKGEVYDPFKEFMIIQNNQCDGKEHQSYKLNESGLSFISKHIQSVIYEIGNLISTFNNLYNCKDIVNDNDWEKLVNQSLLNFPRILISDSFKVEMVLEEVHKNLSKKISNFLRENGVSSGLSILRSSFLGGRGDLLISLHNSFKFLRLDEAAGNLRNLIDSVEMLDELDNFKIILNKENNDLDYEMKLWYDASKELSIFLTPATVSCFRLKTRLSDIVKLICF